MKKRSIILAALMITAALSLTACGGSAKTDSSSTSVSSASTSSLSSESEDTDETDEAEDTEDVEEHSEGLEDHSLGNAFGGKEITVKTWIGENTTFDEKDDDGNVTTGSSLANNVSIAYEVSKAEGKDAKAILQKKVESDAENKKSYLTYDISSVREDGDKVWAVVNYGDDTVKSESILFVQTIDDKSVLSGEIQYYKELSEEYQDYKAAEEDIAKTQEAYGFTAEAGKEVDFSGYSIQSEFELHEVDIPDKDGKAVSKAYTWDKETSFMMDYSDAEETEGSEDAEEKEEEISTESTETAEEISEDDIEYEDVEDEYINGFSTGMKGTYESVEVYKPKEKPNAKTIVQSYLDNMQYFAPEGTKTSEISGDEKTAFMTLLYPAEDDGKQSTVIYAVFAEGDYYKAITVESQDVENKYFKDLLDVYKLQVTEAKNDVDTYDYEAEEADVEEAEDAGNAPEDATSTSEE